MLDLISIGDSTVDNLFKIHDAHLAFSINKEERELCLRYADKIAADEYFQVLGGNNTNHVIGSSRLGLKTAIYTNVGSDGGGGRIIEALKEENVDTRYVKKNSNMSSNASAVVSYKGERTIFVYHQSWDYDLPDLDNTHWIFLSSMSESFTKTNIIDQITRYLERTGARLSYNPGTFQLKYGVKKYPKILTLTTLLIVNITEACTILNLRKKEVDVKQLLYGLLRLGPANVIITDSNKGSYGFNGRKYYKMPIFPATLVEMTGAGDAYGSAATAALFYGKDLAEAMRWGAANSASVVEHIGPQSGLLTYDTMLSSLKRNRKIVSAEF